MVRAIKDPNASLEQSLISRSPAEDSGSMVVTEQENGPPFRCCGLIHPNISKRMSRVAKTVAL